MPLTAQQKYYQNNRADILERKILQNKKYYLKKKSLMSDTKPIPQKKTRKLRTKRTPVLELVQESLITIEKKEPSLYDIHMTPPYVCPSKIKKLNSFITFIDDKEYFKMRSY
jgi:hypothetical protein